jgi:enoyl-CoA hydratase
MMHMDSLVSTTFRVQTEAAVATVVLDRPPANAVNPTMISELLAGLPAIIADPAVRCLVITGSERFFCAGADIAVMRDLSHQNQLAMRGWVEVQRLLELAGVPVIAAMRGHALGGGAELSLACDLRLLGSQATYGFPEMTLGLFPGAGGSQRLPRLVGAHRAKLLMIEGTRLCADEALHAGLVDEVIADDQFDDTVAVVAARWAAKPTRAIALLKQSIDAAAALPIEQALDHEWRAVDQLRQSADAREGLQAFLDRRAAHFQGR